VRAAGAGLLAAGAAAVSGDSSCDQARGRRRWGAGELELLELLELGLEFLELLQAHQEASVPERAGDGGGGGGRGGDDGGAAQQHRGVRQDTWRRLAVGALAEATSTAVSPCPNRTST